MGLIPQHLVARVAEDGSIEFLGELGSDRDVIVVSMRTNDALDLAITDCVDDWLGVVGCVDDIAFGIIAENPNVVINVPFTTVEGEYTAGYYPLDTQAGGAGT